MKLLNKLLILTLTLAGFLSFPVPAYAVCPVCTVAVGAGLGLSRFLGIDDSVSGVWFGGFVLSLSFWTVNWLKAKKVTFSYMLPISLILWFLLTVIPLWIGGVIGHPFNTILGIDKLLIGMALGILAFLLGVVADKKIRQTKGKQLFNYQKVAFPVGALFLTSLIMFFLTSIRFS